MLDYLIKNGWIVNGKNETPFRGDLAIREGRILKIASHLEVPSDLPGERVLEARGGYVTPGFIDIHRHGDWEALKNGDDRLLNRQGITTVVNGNCGLSVAPAGTVYQREIEDFLSSVTGRKPGGEKNERAAELSASMEDYFQALSRVKRSVNTGMLVGNGTLRASVKGYAPGKLSEEEQKKIQKALEASLNAGALGVSLGLSYAPEFEYDTQDLIRVLEPLRDGRIPLVTHVRNEGDGLIPALEEVLQVTKALNIPLHVSHMKCIGKKNWGRKAKNVLELLHRANGEGRKADYDLYPYLVGSTQLVHVLPPECQKGGTEAILARLADKEYRKYLTQILKQPSDEFENIVELAGFEHIFASTLHTEKFAPFAGWSIERIAGELGQDPFDTLYDILLEEKCQVTMLDTVASEEDMIGFLKDDLANLISDAIYPEGGKYHPRVYGAFPRFLVDYVREKPLFTMEEAIWKMTSKPAGVLNLDRGILEAGKMADINVFHLENLKVPADFQDPAQFCSGFDYVLVGGRIAVEKDQWRNCGSGQILRNAAFSSG